MYNNKNHSCLLVMIFRLTYFPEVQALSWPGCQFALNHHILPPGAIRQYQLKGSSSPTLWGPTLKQPRAFSPESVSNLPTEGEWGQGGVRLWCGTVWSEWEFPVVSKPNWPCLVPEVQPVMRTKFFIWPFPPSCPDSVPRCQDNTAEYFWFSSSWQTF